MRLSSLWPATLLTCVILVLYAVTAVATVPEGVRNTLINSVSDRYGISVEDLVVGDMVAVKLPLTGVTAYTAKFIDRSTGQVYGLTTNAAGQEIDIADARQAEAAEARARYGNLRPELHEQVKGSAPDAVIPVGIWLKADGIEGLERPDIDNHPQAAEPSPIAGEPDSGGGSMVEEDVPREELTPAERQFKTRNADEQAAASAIAESLKTSNATHLEATVENIYAPLVAELAELGFEPVYVSITAPLVFYDLPVSVILDLSQRSEIQAIYPNYTYSDAMNSAKPTHKADWVDDVFGYDGSGVEVAIVEDSRIEFNNPYLIAGATRVPGDANVDQHATATAGMVASQHSTLQGISQGASLFSANGTDYSSANISAAIDWAAVTQNNDVINNSWGGNDDVLTLNVHDMHLDYVVRNHWSTVTVAAGNFGTGTGYVASPARAYNVISVGNHQDMDTVGWADDSMRSTSSYIDPSTGCDKPEVAASGSSIESTTDVSPWTGNVGSGTSYSAPMVAGEAALLMERTSSLKILPESVKAIIMASALHNIEGDSRLSEYDGAGSVDMRAAFRIVDEGWWEWDSQTVSEFPYSFYYTAYPGETVRAVIAWDSNPNASYTSDPLEGDIDLVVYDSSGTFVTGSASANNSYEIVEFVPTANDTYEFRISAYSFTGTTEKIGFAFWKGHDVMTPNVIYSRGTPPVSRDHFVADVGGFWSAVGIRSPAEANYNNYLYDGSAFGDPDDHVWLEDSTLSDHNVDFVVIDSNHAPDKKYYLENRASSGSGSYTTQFAPHTADAYDGTYGPYSFSTVQILRIFDTFLTAGVRKYFSVKPTSGDANLDLWLYDSDPSNSATWYQGKSQTVTWAGYANGAGQAEFIDYLPSESDWGGLVVVNDGSTTTTEYYVYTDTTAPTGSLILAGGATVVTSTTVAGDFPASDPDTGVPEFRTSFDGVTFSSWSPYVASHTVTFSSGGPRTFWMQYRNNTNMESPVYSDTVFVNLVGSDFLFYDGFEDADTSRWDSTIP